MIYGILIACMVHACDPQNPQYKKVYGPFNSLNECSKSAGKALSDTPTPYRGNATYTCVNK